MGRPRTSPEYFTCVACRSEFPLNPYRSSRTTCSPECLSKIRHLPKKRRSKATGPTIPKTCELCKIMFLVFPCRANSARFCTNSCRVKWFARNQPIGELHPYWTGGRREYRGPSWKEAKAKARERDGYTCRQCFSKPIKEAVHVHHVIPFKRFGSARHIEANALTNLICLCRSCHMRAERAIGRTIQSKT